MLRPLFLGSVLLAVAAAACNDSKDFTAPGPVPVIQSVTGPAGGVATCSQADGGFADGGGSDCPLSLKVVFRLTEGSFVNKAILRFEGDQDDDGVDRAYPVPATSGAGAAVDVNLTIDALIPPNILRSGALYTYSVRLLTGAGDTSATTTLTVTVP